MTEKKDLYKFTIQFNPGDPSHLQTADLLNQQGRRKAQFIVNAVLHYIHCKETPDIPQAAPMDTELIEAVVRRIMKEQGSAPSKKKPAQSDGSSKKTPEDIRFDEAAEALGADGLAAIANTMTMFRGG